MKILSIETSCDETSIALLENKKIIDCITWSQIKLFKNFGGVVPQIASQNHVMKLPIILKDLWTKNKIQLTKLDLIAYTYKPGLIGCLKIGETMAKTIALHENIKLLNINHLYAHLYVANLTAEIIFPALGLVVSGGHTQIIYMPKPLKFEIIGNTLDDAVGEALDKIGRCLNLDYPAGPKIEQLALNGEKNYHFAIYNDSTNYDFSFSGIKTNAINLIKKIGFKNIKLKDFAFSLQETIFETIKNKIIQAATHHQVKTIVIGGGVATNEFFRKKMQKTRWSVLFPPKKYCTDNAVMIGIMAFYQSQNNFETQKPR